jgi:hypothetical protein
MGLITLAMAPEVHTNDLKSTAGEFLRLSEGDVVSSEIDRPTVQEDQWPAVSTHLEVQPTASVLEGRHRAPCGATQETASLHRLSRSQSGRVGQVRARRARRLLAKQRPLLNCRFATRGGP